MVEVVDGIGLHEVIIPVVCFAVCLSFQAWEFLRLEGGERSRARTLFKSVRAGWVTDNYMKGTWAVNTTRDFIKAAVFYSNTAIALTTFTDNYMKGQAAVNTTRDYIRAAVFFANTAILLTTFIVGFAGSTYSGCLQDGCDPTEWLLVIKLGVLAAVLLVIFFVFTQCTRFAVHFSFCINTRELDGVPLPYELIVKVFNHSHHYYSLGIRLYFGTIPVFAWIFASWALLAVTPVYIYMVRGLEDASFVEEELKQVARLQAERNQPPSTTQGGNATVADSRTDTASSAVDEANTAATARKQHVV